jgi:subtilisin family serine protease
MRKFMLLFIYALFLVHSSFAQIVPPPPSGYFDLIIVFPLDAQPAAIEAVRRDFNATQLAITPVTQARLWRMATSFKSPLTSPLGSYSYSDPLDAVERVRGRTSGVGTGGTAIQINVPTRLPEAYAPVTPNGQPSSLPPLISCMPEVDFVVPSIGTNVVKVAILDTGLETDPGKLPIRFRNSVLARHAEGADARNFTTDYSSEYDINDNHGHGTSVASVVVYGFMRLGKLNCRIVPIKVLSNTGSGNLFALIQGIDHAIQKGVDIINISIVSPDKTDYKKFSTPIELAIRKAGDNSILVVSAAGNSNTDIDLLENRIYPACAPGANQMVVAAGGCSGTRAYFASFGKYSVDIFAPGEQIWVFGLGNVYRQVNGSSFAAPIVAGIAAALRTHSPTRNWKPLDCAIRRGATPISVFSALCTSGGGVHSGRALSSLGSCR